MTEFTGSVIVAYAVALTAAAGVTQAQRDPAGPPDLHGTWVLNKSLSDTTSSLPNDGGTRSEAPGRVGGGRGFGGRGMSSGGGMPPGGIGRESMPDPEQMKKMREVMDELMQAVERFTIVQPEPAVVAIIDADGHARTFSLSGKKERHQLQSATVEVQSRWDGSALRQEISTGNIQIIRTFVRDVEHSRLMVTMAASDSRRGMPPLKRVYDTEER
jgi:hypothetical protein